MTKIIEYEVGKYQGHSVVIRFANVSEEDARMVVDAFKQRLSGYLILDADIQRAVQCGSTQGAIRLLSPNGEETIVRNFPWIVRAPADSFGALLRLLWNCHERIGAG